MDLHFHCAIMERDSPHSEEPWDFVKEKTRNIKKPKTSKQKKETKKLGKVQKSSWKRSSILKVITLAPVPINMQWERSSALCAGMACPKYYLLSEINLKTQNKYNPKTLNKHCWKERLKNLKNEETEKEMLPLDYKTIDFNLKNQKKKAQEHKSPATNLLQNPSKERSLKSKKRWWSKSPSLKIQTEDSTKTTKDK